MNTFAILVLLVSSLNNYLILADDELVTAFVITNTGASAPLCGYIYPSYQIDMNKWSNGLNNMTDVGISEDHLKGQMLKTRYTQRFEAREFQAKFYTSGDYKSKLSTLVTSKGFSGENIGNSIDEIKRVPIRESDQNIEINSDLKLDSFYKCPAIIKALVTSCRQGSNYNTFLTTKTDVLNAMQNNTGYGERWNSFYSTSILYTLMADHYHGNSLPSWVNIGMLQEIASIYLHASPGACNLSHIWYRKIVGSLNYDILSKLAQHSMSANGTSKIYVYTTSSFTFSTLFDLLNIPQRFVNPSSELYIELWRTGHEAQVVVYYKDGINGAYLQVQNQTDVEFRELLNTYADGNVTYNQEECRVTPKPPHPQAVNC